MNLHFIVVIIRFFVLLLVWLVSSEFCVRFFISLIREYVDRCVGLFWLQLGNFSWKSLALSFVSCCGAFSMLFIVSVEISYISRSHTQKKHIIIFGLKTPPNRRIQCKPLVTLWHGIKFVIIKFAFISLVSELNVRTSKLTGLEIHLEPRNRQLYI